jgi:hypothetical protein
LMRSNCRRRPAKDSRSAKPLARFTGEGQREVLLRGAIVRCCHGNLALAERKSEGLGSSSGRRRCLPILERFASEGAERVAGNKMALNVERVMDDGVNG